MNKSNLSELALPISGMTCSGCASLVEDALRTLPGVSNVVVNLASSRAVISFDPKRVDLLEFQQAVIEAGYTVPTREVVLDVQGMSCISCVAHVEGALTDLAGVMEATVQLGAKTARVQYLPEIITLSEMKQAVHHVGYEALERGAV